MDNGSNHVVLHGADNGVSTATTDARNGGQPVVAALTGDLQPIARKAVGGRPFLPGQSGNPAGRKPGSRNKLSELFIAAIREDFLEYGSSAIAALRNRDPAAYLAAVRSMIPAHNIAENVDSLPAHDLDGASDDEWAEVMDAESNPHERATRQARRVAAVELVLSGRSASVREAMRSLGADI